MFLTTVSSEFALMGGLLSFSFMPYSKLLNLPPNEEIVKVQTVAEFSHLLAFTTFYLGYSRRKKSCGKNKICAYRCFNISSTVKMNSTELGGGVTGMVDETGVGAH